MRDFTDKFRFTVRSLPEVFESVANLVSRYRSRGFAIQDKFTREILVNAVFLRFAALPPAEQSAFLRAGMVELEALLGRPTEGFEEASPDPGVKLTDVTTTPPRKPRTKQG